MSADRLTAIKQDLKTISIFTADQNQAIQSIKGEIYQLSEACKKEATAFKAKFGDEWKNLESVQHTLRVINTNLILLHKRAELTDTYIADIYERLTKISTAMRGAVTLLEKQ